MAIANGFISCNASCTTGCMNTCSGDCTGECMLTCFTSCFSSTTANNSALDNGREHRVGAELYDWQFNDTYDISNAGKDVMSIIEQLYTMAIENQEVECDMDRLFGDISDFITDIDINDELGVPYNSYTLEIPMFNVRCLKKLALKRANPRIYTVNETCQMTDIFERRLMLFINGQYFPYVKFFIEYDRFIMILETQNSLFTNEDMRRLKSVNARWSLLMVPFSTTLENLNVNRANISEHGIDMTSFTMVSNVRFTKRNLWLVSVRNNGLRINYPNGASRIHYGTVSTVATVNTVNGKNYLQLPDNFKNMAYSSPISVYATAIPNVKGGLLLNTARAFQIDLDTNPVPPSNIICWTVSGDGFNTVQYIHDAHITLYYPNVYVIENVPDDANIYITWSYYDDTTMKFVNPLRQYMDFNINYASDIINDRIPQAIRAYIPYEHTYFEWHYATYFRKSTRRYNEPMMYTFDTLKKLIDDDATRLESIYKHAVQQTAYKWHSNPKYYISMEEWGSIASRTRRNNHNEIKYGTKVDFNMEYVYFVLEHEDGRSYPISVTIDGVRCMNHLQFTEGFRTFVYVPAAFVRNTSKLEFEIMKVRNNQINSADVQMPPIHCSMELPDNFLDISPQNFMIAIRKEIPDIENNGGMRYVYEVAPNYEMYWLIFGLTKYIHGIPEDYTTEVPEKVSTYTNILTSSDSVLLDDAGNALKTGDGTFWYGGDYHYLLEFGDDISIFETPNPDFPEEGPDKPEYLDAYQVRDLGYYGDARRRFYFYLPNDKFEYVKGFDENGNRKKRKVDPVYITPITDFFADEHVRMVSTDIYRNWKFIIGRDNMGEFDATATKITIDDFYLEPAVNKIRIYLDGRMLDPFYDFITDASMAKGFILGSKVNISIRKKITAPADVLVEFLPYRYQLLYRLEDVSNNNIQLRETAITRPFSMVYYDVYVNGEKLQPDEVEVVTPAKIIIKRVLHNDIVSFYERCHDQDIYDNDKFMKRAIVDAVASEIKEFKHYLLPDCNKGDAIDNIYAPAGCGGGCTTACTTTCTMMCGSTCDTYCGQSCTGNCVTSCVNESAAIACGGCSVGCSAQCYGCAGTCIGMANAFPDACSGCDVECGSSCVGTCLGSATGVSCGNACRNSCSGTVAAQTSGRLDTCGGCSTTCAATCFNQCSGTSTSVSCNACGTTCMHECTNCTGSCVGTAEGLIAIPEECDGCGAACGSVCSHNCSGACLNGCSEGCSGCEGTCDNSCSTLCTGSCQNSCLSDCSGSCSNTSSYGASVTSCAGCYSSCLGNCTTTNASSTECSGCGHTCTVLCTDRCAGSCSSVCRGGCDTSCVSAADVKTTSVKFK